MKRNCTFEKGFNQHLVNVKEWIFARGYPEKWLKTTKTSNFWKTKYGKILLKEYFLSIHSILNLTFLCKKIIELSKYLHIDLEVKTVFAPTPFQVLEKSKITF